MPAPRREAGAVELFEERCEARRNDRVEHHVGPSGHDVLDDSLVIGVIEREILLADNRTALGRDELSDLLVHRVRPDVVGRRHVELPRTGVLHQPGNERVELLRRYRAGAEDQGVAFLALVLLGVDVELLALIDDGSLDGLPGGAVDAPDDDVDLQLVDELRGGGSRNAVIGGAVLDEQLDGTTEQAAGCVDVVDDHLGDVGIGDTHEREGTGLIGDHADPRRSVESCCHGFSPMPGRC